MLKIKALLSNVLQWIYKNRIVTVSQTGTTGSTGNLRLSNVPDDARMVTLRNATETYYAVPFTSNGVWYAKVLRWSVSTYTVASNTSITITANYIVGGGYKPTFTVRKAVGAC